MYAKNFYEWIEVFFLFVHSFAPLLLHAKVLVIFDFLICHIVMLVP